MEKNMRNLRWKIFAVILALMNLLYRSMITITSYFPVLALGISPSISMGTDSRKPASIKSSNRRFCLNLIPEGEHWL